MYVVFINRPFYPSVKGEYETREEADGAAAKWVADYGTTDGHEEASVYVAEVISKTTHKVDY